MQERRSANWAIKYFLYDERREHNFPAITHRFLPPRKGCEPGLCKHVGGEYMNSWNTFEDSMSAIHNARQ